MYYIYALHELKEVFTVILRYVITFSKNTNKLSLHLLLLEKLFISSSAHLLNINQLLISRMNRFYGLIIQQVVMTDLQIVSNKAKK